MSMPSTIERYLPAWLLRIPTAKGRATVGWALLFTVLATTLLVVGAQAYASIAATLPDGAPARARLDAEALRVAGAIVVGSALACLLASTLTAHLIFGRSRMFAEALHRIASGDFEAALPPPPEAELAPVKDAFDRMRTALREALARLEHHDRQRRRLFSDLAHDLATPASAVLSLADTVADPRLCPTDADRARLLELLLHETERLARLVDSIRELALLDDPDRPLVRAPISLRQLAADVVASTQGEVPVGGGDAQVDGDRTELQRALANLVTNARTHGGPSVTVEIHDDGASARLVVDDDGPGVEPEVRAQLGERFYRADGARRRAGHGLGLSIAAAIAHRHGGALQFDASPRGGLRATLRLPKVEERT